VIDRAVCQAIGFSTTSPLLLPDKHHHAKHLAHTSPTLHACQPTFSNSQTLFQKSLSVSHLQACVTCPGTAHRPPKCAHNTIDERQLVALRHPDIERRLLGRDYRNHRLRRLSSKIGAMRWWLKPHQPPLLARRALRAHAMRASAIAATYNARCHMILSHLGSQTNPQANAQSPAKQSQHSARPGANAQQPRAPLDYAYHASAQVRTLLTELYTDHTSKWVTKTPCTWPSWPSRPSAMRVSTH